MKGVRVKVEDKCKPYPICGKQPKVYRDFEYEQIRAGAWCTVECKPFLRKAHLKVESGKALWERACESAIQAWNKRVE